MPTILKKTHHKWQYWLKLALFSILWLYLLFGAGYAYLGANAMISPAKRSICCATPADWGLKYEDMQLQGYDGITLRGWYIPSQNGAAVILLHGYGGTRLSSQTYAEMLARHGYGVLMYDQRACGESDGKTMTWGWLDVADVAGAIAYLKIRPDVQDARLGVMGCSTGAEIALNAAALQPDIRAVISDAPYYSVIQDISPYKIDDWLGMPLYFMFIQFMEWKSGVQAPISLSQAAKLITPRPLLLISAGQDFEMRQAEHFYRLAGEPKELWNIPEAAHCAGPKVRPEEYEQRIVEFLDQALLK